MAAAGQGTGSATGLATSTGAIIAGPNVGGNRGERWVVRTSGTRVHYLNVEMTPDGGTTWYLVKQVGSGVVVPAADINSQVNAAELDTPLAFNERIRIQNQAVGTMDYAFEYRNYING